MGAEDHLVSDARLPASRNLFGDLHGMKYSATNSAPPGSTPQARLVIWKSTAAVEVAVMPACLPMRSSTCRFCTTSSRVGHTQSACGCASLGSTRLSIASTKQVVFPLPLCA